MTESNYGPDPVPETAPEAPPAPDDAESADAYLDATRPAVFPVAGATTGTVPPPLDPGRTP